jgi:uncharacterized membrane protein YhaH (DUF805 family)
MKESILDGFRRWNDYSGRSSRKQFWWFILSFYLAPILGGVLAILSSVFFRLIGLPNFGLVSIVFLIPYLIFIPAVIALVVRRMHDVGKSGWFALVPIYNLYLYLQPSKELGRIPGWIFAERTALVFVGLTVIPVFTDGVSALTGVFFWSAIYVGIRVRNAKKNSSPSD